MLTCRRQSMDSVGRNVKLENPLNELDEMRKEFDRLQQLYRTILPKVDPVLINDLLSRHEKTTTTTGGEPLSYTIEVFTKEGIDVEEAKNYISEKTGMMPSIHDNGTHYVTNQRLTLEMLKEICDSDDVVDVRGSYCGGAGMRAAYYERRQ
jgi:hypothetical protein